MYVFLYCMYTKHFIVVADSAQGFHISEDMQELSTNCYKNVPVPWDGVKK